MSFKITANFHPTLRMNGNLDEARAWMQRVFGRPSYGPPKSFLTAGFPDDYCFMTMIQDLLFDTLDATRLPASLDAVSEKYVPPHLAMLAWYVDDHDALVRKCHDHRIRLLDLAGAVIDGDDAPPPSETGILTFADHSQMGFEYEFLTVAEPPMREIWAQEVDPRLGADWRLPAVSPDDPLRLACCAWHTLITEKPERLRRFFVDLLGGRQIHQGFNEAIGTESCYVALGGAVYELGFPIREGIASDRVGRHLRGLEDCYLGITFRTADLPRARAHLLAEGLSLTLDEADMVMTDAKDSLGVYWGFTTQFIPGDPRGP